MAAADFQHIRINMVKDVAVVEILTKELRGPTEAMELGTELAQVAAQEWAKRMLVNFEPGSPSSAARASPRSSSW